MLYGLGLQKCRKIRRSKQARYLLVLAGCGNAQGVTCLVMTGSSERDL